MKSTTFVPAGEFVIDAKGRKTAVILPIEAFDELMEDMHDLRIVAERKGEEPITSKELTTRLKKRGRV